MIKINLNKEDIFNNQILKNMFIQYLNQKRVILRARKSNINHILIFFNYFFIYYL